MAGSANEQLTHWGAVSADHIRGRERDVREKEDWDLPLLTPAKRTNATREKCVISAEKKQCFRIKINKEKDKWEQEEEEEEERTVLLVWRQQATSVAVTWPSIWMLLEQTGTGPWPLKHEGKAQTSILQRQLADSLVLSYGLSLAFYPSVCRDKLNLNKS